MAGSEWDKNDTPILLDYAATGDPNFNGFPLGQDYSQNYANAKGVYFYIYDEVSQYTVALPSFLKDFSLNMTFKLKETKNPQVKIKKAEGVGIEYNVGLHVPALSVDDARVNATRMATIQSFLNKSVGTTGKGRNNIALSQLHYVLLSNLIHNGKYNSKIIPKNKNQLKQYACPCYLTEFTFTPDIDMGFFEYDQKLFPKVYDTSFKLRVQQVLKPQKAGESSKYIIRSFTGDGDRNSDEIGTSWPFVK